MANYIVGDIQGCLDELQSLLEQVDFRPGKDTLWCVGDLVARGPKSLETLRFIRSLGESAKTVLGNHDLHLQAVALGIKPVKAKDKTGEILTAPDAQELLEWLRHQPLMASHKEFVICHAGISPQWDLIQAQTAADEIQAILQSPEWPALITNMYADTPTRWSKHLQGIKRYHYIINAFTRMRFCYPDGSLDMFCKLPPGEVDAAELVPWFTLVDQTRLHKTILFGHWAALMGYQGEKVIGLDTGCVWGEKMTMLRWEDKCFFEQPSLIFCE